MRVHFIAVGGSAMHNLAIALHQMGHEVSGSDDKIYEPSRSRLVRYNLLPDQEGWDANRIHDEIDAIILGMHARQDNPELKRAQELGLHIYSYPEFLYEQSKHKKRVVIGGSHGKTSITSMILHVLQAVGIPFDYMVGAQLEGFDTMVQLTDAPLIILEGDEYLSSPLDLRPKFHWYRPDVALLSGIAWDHINVFPTFKNYVSQFEQFIDLIEAEGCLIYYEGDTELKSLAEKAAQKTIAYETPAHRIENGISYLLTETEEVPLQIFGAHNLQNLNGARLVCQAIGVDDASFYKAIKTFKGAAKRLEKIADQKNTTVFKDFAHSPSKLKATTAAVKKQFPDRKLIACMELHTFSSLNAAFLKEYHDSMLAADEALVYFNPETLAHRRLPEISKEQVAKAFGGEQLNVFTESNEIRSYLASKDWDNSVLLLMTSGNFDGIDLDAFGRQIAASA